MNQCHCCLDHTRYEFCGPCENAGCPTDQEGDPCRLARSNGSQKGVVAGFVAKCHCCGKREGPIQFCETCTNCDTCMAQDYSDPCPCGGHVPVPAFTSRAVADQWLEANA